MSGAIPESSGFGFRSLREIIGGSGISASQFRRIAIELTESLAEHHQQGQAHGFLTLDNIVLNPESQACILGWGQTAPPDLFDPQPDLQALGRIFYALATGHDAGEILDADPQRIPAELRFVILRAIEGGYLSAGDLAAAVRAWQPIPIRESTPRRLLWLVPVLVVDRKSVV